MSQLSLRQTIPPADEPITLDQAKAHLRVSIPDDDDLIAGLIAGARQWAENYTRRQFMPATWRLTLDYFPGRFRPYADGWLRERAWEHGRYFQDRWILLPRPRLQAVLSVAYTDTSGAQQTLDPSQYVIDTEGEPGRIAPVAGGFWPDTQQQLNAVQITYRSGYTDTSATTAQQRAAVPQNVVARILLKVGTLYESREEFVESRLTEMPHLDGLLDSEIVPWLF